MKPTNTNIANHYEIHANTVKLWKDKRKRVYRALYNEFMKFYKEKDIKVGD